MKWRANGSLMDIYFRQSKLRAAMKYLGFVWRVLRRLVWETATDTTTGLAAQMAYLLYFGTVFIATISRALTETHGVREDPHWWSKYIISFLLLFWFGIIILFCFNAMVFGETLAGIAEVNFQLKIPLQEWVAALNLPFT